MSLLALLAAQGTAPTTTPVTATAPTADDTANTITIPAVTGVEYRIGGSPVTGTVSVGDVSTTVTVTAHALSGYHLTGTTSWPFTFTASTTGLVNLYPSATPATVPTPIAHWDFREVTPPYLTTAATGADLPLVAKTTATTTVTSELGTALYLDGTQALAVPGADVGRLNIGGNEGDAVSVGAWVWISRFNQSALAGIWGEFADPPQRQYALFFDLPAYGGDDMSCFHVSKDGAPTPGYPFSTDYSANPKKALPGRWHHFLGTYDGTEAVSYIDGVAYQHTTGFTRENDGRRNPYTFLEGLNPTPHEFAVSIGAPLAGLMKDVKVWDQALTPGHALTLAAEHAPLPPATYAAGVGYELMGQTSTDTDSATGEHTFTAMPIGAPAPDRLVVAALHGVYNPPRSLTSATIGGITATVVQQSGLAFAYAVVPTGTTADVEVVWNGQTWDNYCATFVLTGTATAHTSSDGGSGVKTARTDADRGGIALCFGWLAADTASWSDLVTRLTQGVPTGATSGQRYSLAVTPTQGHPAPVFMTNGIGTAAHSMLVISFDPA